MEQLHIFYEDPNTLKPHPSNVRVHSRKQVRQIAQSLKEFGFLLPILIDADRTIIAGHGRVEAAKLNQLNTIPVVRCDGLSDAQIKAFMIADNKLVENASWDRVKLAVELQDLIAPDLEFDVTITGFEMPEVDLLIGEIADQDLDDRAVPIVDMPRESVSLSGDVWKLGDHRLMCGNALEASSYERLLGGDRAQIVFTDPPYNVPIDGHVSGLGSVRHREFAMATGEMSEPEFVDFLSTVFAHLACYSVDGSIHYVCMDWRHLFEMLTAGRGIYSELKNICVWNKTNGGMGSLYRSKHELVAVFKHGTVPHINNVELGRHGRNRTNVWDYPGGSTFSPARSQQLAMHPTVKPIDMVADALLDCSDRGSVVLDCFGGSGTTLLAAEQTGRRAYLMELDPLYVDLIIRRYQALTGGRAKLVECGTPFDDLDAVVNGREEMPDAA